LGNALQSDSEKETGARAGAVSLLQWLPRNKVPPEVRRLLEQIECGEDRIAVACSGGADSVLLVFWLLEVFPDLRSRVLLLHYDHGTRNGGAARDAEWVRLFATELGLELRSGVRHGGDGGLSEAQMRELRHEFFRKVMQEEAVTCLLTGHHLDDRIETLLMRLSRGSGLEGLVGLAPLRRRRDGRVYLSPFADCSRQSIRGQLHGMGRHWCEDSSNGDVRHLRNALRREVIPLWMGLSPQNWEAAFRGGLSLLEADADALHQWAQRALEEVMAEAPGAEVFPLSRLRDLPLAVQRRCLWLWLNSRAVGPGVSGGVILQALALSAGQGINIGAGKCLRADEQTDLVLEDPNSPEGGPSGWEKLAHVLAPGHVLFFPDGAVLRVERCELADFGSLGQDDPRVQVHLDSRVLGDRALLCVGFRRPGLRYRPLGCAHEQSLKRNFISRRVPVFERSRLPVIQCLRGGVLWVPGLPPADAAKVQPATKCLLRLTYLRN
jgi:tRNA(Ile)-lysidine synthase